MSEQRGIPGCFKMGCFGCLGLVALFIGCTVIVGVIQVNYDHEPDLQDISVEKELPESPLGLLREGAEGREILPLPEDFDGNARGGRLELDLSMGEFELRSGPAGEPLRVEAKFDNKTFYLKEDLETADDGTWIYRVKFKSRGGFLGAFFGEEVDNRVVITIPRDQPIDLAGSVSLGEHRAYLGGLWIRSVDMELGVGEHRLVFDEPPPVPMESFVVDGSIGEIDILSLGNASPETIDVEHSIGEVYLGLDGAWQRDAEARVVFSIGEGNLALPAEGVRVEVDAARVNIGETQAPRIDNEGLPEDAPTLKVRMEGNIGEINTGRR